MRSAAGAGGYQAPSRDGSVELEKIARSVATVEPALDSVPEVMIFLEVLGHSDASAARLGYKSLHDLASDVYDVLDHYMDRSEASAVRATSALVEIPSAARRLGRGFAVVFPWLGSLAVMAFFGVSLWLVWVLPLYITTALIVGVFFGLLMSEGMVQLFQRLYSFYYAQYNVSEMRRAFKRMVLLSVAIAALMVAAVWLFGACESIPIELVLLTLAGSLSLFGHRVSYIIVYSLRRYAQIVVSYAVALAALVSIYFLMYDIIPLTLTRYLVALGAAVLCLSVLPIYYAYRVFTAESAFSLDETTRNPFNTLSVLSRTIPSRFWVQFWEGLPYYLYGTLFFAMLFGDRVLSWYYNPSHSANGLPLPLVFNPTYHLGADVALFVIFPAAILQFVLSSPMAEQLSNLATRLRVADANAVEEFLKEKYEVLVLGTLLVAVLCALPLIIFAPTVEAFLGGTEKSVFVLRTASVANVFIAVFMANSLFLIFMNRVQTLLPVVALGVAVVGVGGFIFGTLGFQDIVVAYLFASIATMTISSALVAECLKRPGALFFSRYL